jgi:hypothetical protein
VNERAMDELIEVLAVEDWEVVDVEQLHLVTVFISSNGKEHLEVRAIGYSPSI